MDAAFLCFSAVDTVLPFFDVVDSVLWKDAPPVEFYRLKPINMYWDQPTHNTNNVQKTGGGVEAVIHST